MVFNHEKKAFVLLSVVILEIAFLPLAAMVGGTDMGTVGFLFYSFLVATLVSGAMLIYKGRTGKLKDLMISKKGFAILVLAGLLNYAISSLLLTFGTVNTTASLGGVIYRSWVLFMIPFIPFVLRTKVNKYQIAALSLGFISVYVALTQGSLLSINSAYAPFIMVLLGSAIVTGLSNVLIKSQNNDLYAQVFLFSITSFMLLGIIALAFGISIPTAVLPIDILAAMFVGGITYSFGASFYFYSLKALDPAMIANAMLIVPFLTFGFAALLEGEAVYPYYIILGLLVVAGVFIQRMSPQKAPERMKSGHIIRDMRIFDLTGAFVDNKSAEIYAHIKGNSRALAATGEIAETYEKLKEEHRNALENKHGCMLFTDSKPHNAVRNEELDFIRDVLGTKHSNEKVLIGIGHPDSVENAINEIASAPA